MGRASAAPPCLIDLHKPCAKGPKIRLVGKGVCFDTGGLNLKSSDNMLLMKKDMGGAAHVLALAQWLWEDGLDIDLRVLIPAIENSVSGNGIRPLDIIPSRKG